MFRSLSVWSTTCWRNRKNRLLQLRRMYGKVPVKVEVKRDLETVGNDLLPDREEDGSLVDLEQGKGQVAELGLQLLGKPDV